MFGLRISGSINRRFLIVMIVGKFWQITVNLDVGCNMIWFEKGKYIYEFRCSCLSCKYVNMMVKVQDKLCKVDRSDMVGVLIIWSIFDRVTRVVFVVCPTPTLKVSSKIEDYSTHFQRHRCLNSWQYNVVFKSGDC